MAKKRGESVPPFFKKNISATLFTLSLVQIDFIYVSYFVAYFSLQMLTVYSDQFLLIILSILQVPRHQINVVHKSRTK